MTGPEDRSNARGSGPWSALAIHVTVYVAVNLLLIACWVLFSGGSVGQVPEVLASLDTARNQQFWPMYVIVFWGTALVIHAGVVVATTPGRRRRRRERRRQQRRRAAVQASVVGVLPDGMITDAALAGIRLTDGDKAARQVQRDVARRGSGGTGSDRTGGGSKGSGSRGSGSKGADPKDTGSKDRDPSGADRRAPHPKGRGREARDSKDRDPKTREPEGADPTSRDREGEDRTATGLPPSSDSDGSAPASSSAEAPGSTEVSSTPERAPTAASGEPSTAGLGTSHRRDETDGGASRGDSAPPDRRAWVAVLFTDIVDSTSLNESLGDDAWASMLADHRALVRRLVADHDGREVGTQGDGFLLRFSVPDDAVRCAVAIQEQLAQLRTEDGSPYIPAVRMGVHAGEAVHHDGDDLVGRVVNLAARVTDAADADEILVTEPVADHLGGDFVLVDRGLRQLKGFDRPRHLLAVVWQPAADAIDLAEPPSHRTEA